MLLCTSNSIGSGSGRLKHFDPGLIGRATQLPLDMNDPLTGFLTPQNTTAHYSVQLAHSNLDTCICTCEHQDSIRFLLVLVCCWSPHELGPPSVERMRSSRASDLQVQMFNVCWRGSSTYLGAVLPHHGTFFFFFSGKRELQRFSQFDMQSRSIVSGSDSFY